MTIRIALVSIVAVCWYLSWIAGRVDHLNRRTRIAHDALLRNLEARAHAVINFERLHPSPHAKAAGDAARSALQATNDSERAPRESAVSTGIWALVDHHGVIGLEEVRTWSRRVQLSRRFHGDAVRATAHIRSRRIVRWFRLDGHSRPVRTLDFADDLPPGF